MKRYKLIREYPGSPKLGTIRNWNPNIWSDNNDFKENKTFAPNNYPEFWEEIVEKDYEIISLSDKRNQFPILNLINGCSPVTGIKYPELGSKDWRIHSVKRLSDGEIFTIGDFVNGRTISSFSVNWIEIGLKIHCDNVGKGNINDGCFFKLQDLEKIKQPLFTTEDGVDIFEGDKIYEVILENFHLNKDMPAKLANYILGEKYISKLFSTKEKAEEYILMNKPVLSLSDVWDHLSIKNRKLIIPFVKNKLNQ